MGPRQNDCEVYGLKLPFRQNLLRKKHSEAIAVSQLEEPIRAELFSSERLEQHGESLAVAQRVTTVAAPGSSVVAARAGQRASAARVLSYDRPGNS